MAGWKMKTIEREPKVSARLQVSKKLNLDVDESCVGGYRAYLMYRGQGKVGAEVVAHSPTYPTIEQAQEAGIKLARQVCAEFAEAARMIDDMAEICA